MKMKTKIALFACAGLLAADLSAEQTGIFSLAGLVIGKAEARIGRPATPRSVAGVARRTTRRTIRRTSTYIATLPAGCIVETINGSRYWLCGGTYYAASGNRYVVVIID